MINKLLMIFTFLLLLLASLGLFYLLFLTPTKLSSNSHASSATLINSTASNNINKYFLPLLTSLSYGDPALNTLMGNLIQNCTAQNLTTCTVFALYQYIENNVNVTILGNNANVKSPETTLSTGSGTDADIAVLTASLLNYQGIENYLAYKDSHYFNVVCGVALSDLLNQIENYITDNPIIDMNLTLDKGKIWMGNTTNNSLPTSYQIMITSTSPLIFAVFNDNNSLASYINGNETLANATVCNSQGTNISLVCSISNTNSIAIISQAFSNLVTFDMYNNYISPTDIKLINTGTSQCLPFDATLRSGLTYPGMIAPMLNDTNQLILIQTPNSTISNFLTNNSSS